MAVLKFSLRSLFISTTILAMLVGGGVWASRRYGQVRLLDTTPAIANKALRAFARVPSNATDVDVEFTPFHTAIIEFRLGNAETRQWCRENAWQITPDSTGEGFGFSTPTGSGRWFHDEVQYIEFAK